MVYVNGLFRSEDAVIWRLQCRYQWCL